MAAAEAKLDVRGEGIVEDFCTGYGSRRQGREVSSWNSFRIDVPDRFGGEWRVFVFAVVERSVGAMSAAWELERW